MAAIWPDTCVPTCTVFTALSAPVAETVASRLPRVTAANRYAGASFASARRYIATLLAATTTTAAAAAILFLFIRFSSRFNGLGRSLSRPYPQARTRGDENE